MDNTKLTTETFNKIAEIYAEKYFNDQTDIPFVDKFLSLINSNSRILDIGCGPGNFTKYIIDKGFHTEGIDLSENMLAIAKRKVTNSKFQIMDMRKLNYPKNSFDGLLVAYSLIHVSSDEIVDTLKGFSEVLKKGGKILIIVQAGESDRIVEEPLLKGAHIFINFFTRNKIENYLEKTGFKVVFQKEKQLDDNEELSNRVIYTIAEKI
jgi:ubiquinone/menaquinone biosynthesis C-methylase UbiE